MTRQDIFKEELGSIKSKDLRSLASFVLDSLTSSFFTLDAGYEHFKDERGKGGLVLHTKRVCKVGEKIIGGKKSSRCFDPDIVRLGCLFHDICKPSSNHPEEGFRYFLSLVDSIETTHPQDLDPYFNNPKSLVFKIKVVARTIRAHHGRFGWYRGVYTEDRIVHLADYIAAFYGENLNYRKLPRNIQEELSSIERELEKGTKSQL